MATKAVERKRRPTHPGEILREETVPAMGLSRQEFADRLGVSRQTVQELLAERRGVSADMALRLGRLLNTSAEMWLDLQKDVDLWDAKQEHGREHAKIRPAKTVAALG